MALGKEIKRRRKAKGWTQEHLAQLVDLTPRSIMYIENDALCGPLHDDKLFFVHSVQHTVKVFPAFVLSVVPVRVEKFIS